MSGMPVKNCRLKNKSYFLQIHYKMSELIKEFMK